MGRELKHSEVSRRKRGQKIKKKRYGTIGLNTGTFYALHRAQLLGWTCCSALAQVIEGAEVVHLEKRS